MSFVYLCLQTLAKIIGHLFFKDIEIIGLENIPKDGPVIVCGNHYNQFLDAFLMCATVPRQLGFIIAAKSYRKKGIGDFAKALHAIPVERPQDVAKNGIGSITQITATVVIGVGTKFTEQVKPGDSLKIKDIAVDVLVKQVNSDTELTYAAEGDITQSNVELSYKVMPKLDQAAMYDAVWQRLKEEGAIGIFPEGGSHDNTQMLPLKAGVCIMALGAMINGSKPVKILPCGFSYFKGYKFRSKVVIQFGTPYEVPESLVEVYKKSRKEAIAPLLNEVEKKMKSVTISAPTYAELMALHRAREIYLPANTVLKTSERHLINQILALGYSKMKEDPKVQEFINKCTEYDKEVRKLRLTDTAVKNLSRSKIVNIWNALTSLFLFLITGIIALPAVVIHAPYSLLVAYLSEKERKKAVKSSNVKVKGTDVVASHKILCAVMLFPVAEVTSTIGFALFAKFVLGWSGKVLFFSTILFFFVWPIYTYISILASGEAIRYYRNVKARLILVLFRPRVKALLETRQKLQKRIEAFVALHADEVISHMGDEDVIVEKEGKVEKLIKRNSIGAIDALEQAFDILEEIGI